jgi:7-carboxy-7-deazaguanine synthase (Cx14CxxC type)
MSYSVKELFYSLQGEGFHAGRPAVFCRFAGCNLWSGHEKDRHRSRCAFCDTDIVGTDGPGGGRYDNPEVLAQRLTDVWPDGDPAIRRFLVLTGGEPLLQVDPPLLQMLRQRGFETAVETNGTRNPPPGIDWICVSPKREADLVLTWGDELKLVYPQEGVDPRHFEGMDFKHFFLQPRDGPERDVNLRLAVEYCLEHPRWRLSLQLHKYIGIP